MISLSVGVLFVLVSGTTASGCSWTGQMPGPGGNAFCPPPVSGQQCPQTPTYEELKARSKLWPCPSYTQENGSQYYGPCTEGQGSNPLCKFKGQDHCYIQGDTGEKCDSKKNSELGCCCPLDGCWTPPYFNWIIAACRGSGCGNYNGAKATQKYKDAGTQLVVNYVASYQWNKDQKQWQIVKDSSFNTDGSKPPFDVALPNGGHTSEEAWMQPQPGGAAAWTWGYYPAGVKGVGPPGMMFVMSTEKSINLAWYMLNQVTLDKGPAIEYPRDGCLLGNNNCWAAGNAGEIDFLESPWTVDAGAADNYGRLFSTQWNQVGRSFIGNKGSTGHADGGWFNEKTASNNYFLGSKSTAHVFVAVVDQIGTFIYRIPGVSVEKVWPGLTRTTASCSLQSRPSQRPPNSGPPCNDQKSYCALFLPNCQAHEWGGTGKPGGANQGCTLNDEQGWCKNWWQMFENTDQWLWPENGRKSVVQYQAPAPSFTNPWNYEMEAREVDWQGKVPAK